MHSNSFAKTHLTPTWRIAPISLLAAKGIAVSFSDAILSSTAASRVCTVLEIYATARREVPHSEQNLDVGRWKADPHSSQNEARPPPPCSSPASFPLPPADEAGRPGGAAAALMALDAEGGIVLLSVEGLRGDGVGLALFCAVDGNEVPWGVLGLGGAAEGGGVFCSPLMR